MTYTGHMQNGVVVFDGPAPFPDGASVEVQLTTTAPPAGPQADEPTLAERYAAIIGAAPELPPDMADNHDHYLHGTPKR